ncbi:ComEC/Rec2 family competence protein [Lentisalinibacter salinarum]|uniref:hypothetical protein n=1 Tax=Lentisalinibacter salinarum TaxID=2992239 RepID=UPI0038693674
MPSEALTPVKLTIRAYNVGFGDCNLLTFDYPNFVRNVLIDFGSTRLPANSNRNNTRIIANQIKHDCGGKLDAIVATHRHKDHISGFATNKSGTGPGDIIRKLEPDIIVQPWTEHPDAPVDAEVAPSLKAFHAYQQRLRDMETFAESVHSQLKNLRGLSRVTRSRLRFMGENNITNRAAVLNLKALAEAAVSRGESSRHGGYFVYTGSNSGLGHLLPNVDVEVLGPPTLKQSREIESQVHSHPDQFWHMQAKASSAIEQNSPFPAFHALSVPPYARWLRQRLDDLRAEELFRIVRILDDVLNNTSVILLFKVGDQAFLFPGDAQWENWSYALDQPRYQELLRKVQVYKIGHHGSLNATPKSLWQLFERRGPHTRSDRLQSLLSTKEGVHGSPERDSEVPRTKLVDAVREDSRLLDTRQAGHTHCIKTDIAF